MSTGRITERFTVGDESTGLARWKRTAYRTEDGEFFVPAYSFGDESMVVLAASYDGVPLIENWGHVYVPFSWARREFPGSPFIEIFDRRVASVREGNAGR